MKKREGNYSDAKQLKSKLVLTLVVNLFFAFNFFVFGPLEMYILNVSEFWFSLSDILPSILLTSISVFFVLTLSTMSFRGKYHNVMVALIFSLGVCFYVQGNIINADYELLNGKEINWGDYTTIGAINTIVWVLLLLLPFVLLKYKRSIFKNTLIYSSLFIFLVQVITLSALMITSDFEKERAFHLSENNKFESSSRENVVVFVLDTFDASVMNQVLTERPEYEMYFEDFTYYVNTVGAYQVTKGAIPFILTGKYNYNEERFPDYIVKAFDETELYSKLKGAGYDTRLYVDSTMFLSRKEADKIDNIEFDTYKISSKLELTRLLYKFVGFRYMPHYLKNNFWMYTGDFNSTKSFENKEGQIPYRINKQAPIKHNNNDVDFYDQLTQYGITVGDELGTFRLYHLNGIHFPFTIDENVKYVSEDKADELNQAYGVLNIVIEYIEQLKEKSIYDNTMFVIMADHGYKEMAQNPLLMIKTFNERKPFKISSAPISFEDFHPTLLSEIFDTDTAGRSILEIREDEVRERKYMYFGIAADWNGDYLPDTTEYITTGVANDITKFRKTGNLYTKQGIEKIGVKECKLNETLNFSFEGKASEFFSYGMSQSEGGHAWTQGEEAQLSFRITDQITSDIRANIKLVAVYKGEHNKQRLIIKAGKTVLYENTLVPGEKEINFIIPLKLIGENNLITLDMMFPDAISPARNNDVLDMRVLAFAFSSMSFSDKDTGAEKYVDTGWYDSDSSIIYAGKHAIKYVTIKEAKSDIEIYLSIYKPSYSGATSIYINDSLLTVWKGQKDNEFRNEIIKIPKEYIKDGEIQKMFFDSPEAISPKAAGINQDIREIGFGLISLEVKE